MMTGALTVHASDRDFNTGAGIKFEGSGETETEEETEANPIEKPTDKTDTSTTSSNKPSLPQTGQGSGRILQMAGILLLFLVCMWTAAKKRRESTMFPERKRAR